LYIITRCNGAASKKVKISKWGNSLGVRLPRSLAEHIGVNEGQFVEISVDGARLTVEPIKHAYSLADLLVNMTPDAMREAFDWGEDVGRERVDG
jgi:antitoxin MazE